MSPRKIVAEVRSRFGTSSSKAIQQVPEQPRLSASVTPASADTAPHGEYAQTMDFSLLESMQPSMPLFFVLGAEALIGYADASREDALETIPLAKIRSVKRPADERLNLVLRDGEKLFFSLPDADSWAGALLERLKKDDEDEQEEMEEPEFGMCELHLDIAEEISVLRRASVQLRRASGPAEAVLCPVCGSNNSRSSARCAECGSSDGYAGLAPIARSSGGGETAPAGGGKAAPLPPPKPKGKPSRPAPPVPK